MAEITGANGRVYRIECFPAPPVATAWPGTCADCGRPGVVDVPGARCDTCGRAHHGATLAYYQTGRTDLYRTVPALDPLHRDPEHGGRVTAADWFAAQDDRWLPVAERPLRCRVCLAVHDPVARTVEHPDIHPTCDDGWQNLPEDTPMETPIESAKSGSTPDFSAPENGVLLDLYAGAGGWDEGAAMLGVSTVGIEIEEAPCATAEAAGHPRLRADVATHPMEEFRGRLLGLVASPPCQAYSMAGKRDGEKDRTRMHDLVDAYAAGLDTPWPDGWADDRSHHAAQPVRWVRELRPPFVVLEQVPPVLDLWKHIAHVLRGWDYSVWTGILNAADYGVPQTRQRAILIARLGAAAGPPAPTHAKEPTESLFGEPLERWVSMAVALGWTGNGSVNTNQNSRTDRHGGSKLYERDTDRPSPTLTTNVSRWAAEAEVVLRNNTNENACERTLEEPAGTLFFGARANDVSWHIRMSHMDNASVRPVDGPAPTVAISRDGNALWTLHTNRDQREDGSRQTRGTDNPAPSVTGKSGDQWAVERPATTVLGEARIGRPGHKGFERGGESQFARDAVRVTVQEAAVLQSFPADYPWTGNKTAQFLQVGNAVPPRLAAHVLAAAMGRDTPEIRPVERPKPISVGPEKIRTDGNTAPGNHAGPRGDTPPYERDVDQPAPTVRGHAREWEWVGGAGESDTNEEAVIDPKGDSYAEFLARKTQWDDASGFDPLWMPDFLYPFQAHLVDWAIRMGRCGLFTDCGTGKTPMQLVWAENVRRHTGKPVLIVTPLAVGYQTVVEAAKFGVEAAISRDGKVTAPITVTNYERLEKFDTNDFGGVVCDESSAIKAFDGKRRAIVTEFLRTHRYRLLGTATAAPNDYTELGTASEALGYLGHMDMLGRFFINKKKTADTQSRWRATNRTTTGGAVFHVREPQQWRFKGHSEEGFWRWVASWSRALRTPSDLGFEDDGFILPPLEHRQHVVRPAVPLENVLFEVPAVGLREERAELRATLVERCQEAAKVLADADCAVAWCHLNEEGKTLTREIDGAVEVTGSMPADQKEEILHAFGDGEIRVLVTKPSIAGWGLNWQHANRMTFFPSHSYEQYYQAVRRMWRFGQPRPVTVDIITTPGGANALSNLQRKADAADRMFDQLVTHMRDAAGVRRVETYENEIEVPSWL